MTPTCFVVAGPSGAGKAQALRYFGEFDYLCLAEVPATDAPAALEALAGKTGKPIALSLANRQLSSDALAAAITALRHVGEAAGRPVRLLALHADVDNLIGRHLAGPACADLRDDSRPLPEALQAQLELLMPVLKAEAEYTIDTGGMQPEELRLKIGKLVGKKLEPEALEVSLVSFGFKYGAPRDAEMVFDMRFLQNPFYDETLRPLTGLDAPIVDYVMAQPEAKAFLEHAAGMLKIVLPKYRAQGKLRVTVGVGCTGGKHRSVCIAEALAEALQQAGLPAGIRLGTRHRDMPVHAVASSTSSSEAASCAR